MQRLGNQLLRNVRSVRLCRVEEIHAELHGAAQDRERFLAIAGRSPNTLTGDAHCAEAKASDGEVVTSAQVASGVLAERLPAGAAVLIVGTEDLAAEVADVGLRPVWTADDGPQAVIQGYGREVGWTLLAEACVAVRGGAWWLATNADRTLPSDRGPLPGNGVAARYCSR
jgi:ribonucleotide monophosphatase NagD (HAD superfamily)